MTAPQIAGFGYNPGYFPPQAGQQFAIGDIANANVSAQTAGGLRLCPVYLPFPVTPTALGVNVSTAGAVGSTLTPTIYKCDANGNPGALFAAGPALSTAAVAFATGAFATVIPPGWYWVGGLHLSAGAAATVWAAQRPGAVPWGGLVRVDGANPALPFAVATGLGAVPDPFVGTYASGNAPMIYVVT